MSETVNLHVGSIEEMGKRFIGAWYRLEHGEAVKETHLTFFDLETMMSTLSPKRLALLRHVHQHPAKTVSVDNRGQTTDKCVISGHTNDK